MTASKLPVGLPHPHPTKAYWQTPPHPIADHRTTPDLPPAAEYVIIGSGITGASIAHKLLQKQPDASMVMLEARQASSGATGRNGGHCRAGWYLYFADEIEQFGTEEAVRMLLFEEANVRNLVNTVKDLDIDCDLRKLETVDTFTDPKQWDEALEALKAIDEVEREDKRLKGHVEHKIWSEEETKNELLIRDGVGAISFPGFILSPYKLVCSLLETAIKKGLNLQTNTPVVEVAPTSIHFSSVSGEQLPHRRRWVVTTEDRGEIIADKVILATNAYTAALYPPLAEFIIPTRGQLAAIRPGSKIDGNPIFQRSCALNSAESGDYFQSRGKGVSGEGDLLVGGGRRMGTHGEQPILDDSVIHPDISAYLSRRVPVKYFGRETWGADGEVLQEWTGIMGYTVDKQPIIGEAVESGHQGLYICAGFHGHGMGRAFQSAEALVQILMGNEEAVAEWLPDTYRLSRVFENKESN